MCWWRMSARRRARRYSLTARSIVRNWRRPKTRRTIASEIWKTRSTTPTAAANARCRPCRTSLRANACDAIRARGGSAWCVGIGASRREAHRTSAWLRSPMAEGKQGIPGRQSVVRITRRGLHATCNPRRSHRPAPWRYGEVLESCELAGLMWALSFST